MNRMNKAFTKESDDGFDEIVPEPKDLLPPGKKNYVTPEGAEQLRAELEHWVEVERPRVLGGDAAESGPGGNVTLEKRKRLQAIDRRIRFLQDRVANMEVVETSGREGDRIRFGASVTVEDEEGNEKTYKIVGVDEADPSAGKVSWLSPIAKALLGASPGDLVEVELPHRTTELEITGVRH
jgi:transcription elongation factor GreB